MKTLRLIALAAFLALAPACATLQPGADPIAVRSEQTVSTAFNVIDAFLTLEHQHRELSKAKLPAVHAFAEFLRAPVADNGQTIPRGLALIQSANRVRLAYKANRTPDNHASMTAALSALARAANEAATHLATLQTLTR